MTQPRAHQVCLDMTPYYHCIGRCVRRAWLCGFDEATATNYEHRREWMAERLSALTQSFAIDVCGYALMSNHYHLVVKVCADRVDSWSDREVYERWTAIYGGPPVVHRLIQNSPLSPSEADSAHKHLANWRQRLGSLSWFMRSLNEYIARKANAEDGCTGHFWEARFKSQALLDDKAVLAAMAYVDLNPVRAGIARSIPDSDYTSAQQRYRHVIQHKISNENVIPLLKMRDDDGAEADDTLPFRTQDYLELLDITGRVMAPGKRGMIDNHTPRLLQSWQLEMPKWQDAVSPHNFHFANAIGHPAKLLQLAARTGRRWVRQTPTFKRLYQSS